MKKFLWILLPVAAIGFVLYYLFARKPKNQSGAVKTTNTAGPIAQWFPGWNGFTSASLNNLTQTTKAATGLLGAVSNAFGFNDGGNSGGVSVGGSSAGGVNSSGSGAGLPLFSIGNVSDIWDTGFNQGDYGLAPLNNYDVLNASGNGATQQQVDTGIDGFNPTGLYA